MATTIQATYDGTVFRPDEAVDLPVGTAVTVSIPANAHDDPTAAHTDPHGSFLRNARGLVKGAPADWSANPEKYDDVDFPDS